MLNTGWGPLKLDQRFRLGLPSDARGGVQPKVGDRTRIVPRSPSGRRPPLDLDDVGGRSIERLCKRLERARRHRGGPARQGRDDRQLHDRRHGRPGARVTCRPELVEQAGIKDQVMLVGLGDRLEVWSNDALEACSRRKKEQIRRGLEALFDMEAAVKRIKRARACFEQARRGQSSVGLVPSDGRQGGGQDAGSRSPRSRDGRRGDGSSESIPRRLHRGDDGRCRGSRRRIPSADGSRRPAAGHRQGSGNPRGGAESVGAVHESRDVTRGLLRRPPRHPRRGPRGGRAADRVHGPGRLVAPARRPGPRVLVQGRRAARHADVGPSGATAADLLARLSRRRAREASSGSTATSRSPAGSPARSSIAGKPRGSRPRATWPTSSPGSSRAGCAADGTSIRRPGSSRRFASR